MHVLLESGAVPNALSSRVSKELGVTPEGPKRVVTVANGLRAGVLGKLNDVLVEIGCTIVKMDFVVLDKLLFHIVIWRSTIARLGGVLDFQKSEVSFEVGVKKTILAMIPGRYRGDDISSEYFTSSSSEEEREKSSTEDEGVEEEELVLMIGKKVDSEERLKPGSEVEMGTKLSHLPRTIWRRLKRMLQKKGLVAESLYDLRRPDQTAL